MVIGDYMAGDLRRVRKEREREEGGGGMMKV